MSKGVWIVGPDEAVVTGFFRARLVRGGPHVPVRCWQEDGERDPETGDLMSDQITRLEIDGKPVDPFQPGFTLLGEPISDVDFRYMVAMRNHAVRYEPHLPQANPDKRIDLNELPPIY